MKKPQKNPAGACKTIALAGNPNVGKSTVFNALTGLRRHTGNWAGKTVDLAFGTYTYQNAVYTLADLPGTYSLFACSKEERFANDYIHAKMCDAVAVICDATCLSRGLRLVLQIAERTPNVLVCVNLLDEAKKQGITPDLSALQAALQLPVVGLQARNGKGLDAFRRAVKTICRNPRTEPLTISYPAPIEAAIRTIEPTLLPFAKKNNLFPRAIAIQLLQAESETLQFLQTQFNMPQATVQQLQDTLETAKSALAKSGMTATGIQDAFAAALQSQAKSLAALSIPTAPDSKHKQRQERLDRFLLSKKTGIPVLLCLLLFIFWLTITGANYPSAMLSDALFRFQDVLLDALTYIGVSPWLRDLLVLGMYRVLAWVVAVMLPPMAIFFPLFTLLEDFGYLPRVAFQLDRQFRRCNACGKQALTMCMGFGCNAVGVTGCRIIDSPRERLVAMLTNSFVPCNGRFPTLISIISMFFLGASVGGYASVLSSLLLTGTIVFSVGCTFLAANVLSKTILRGVPSAFTLELPPFRRPQICKSLVRSVLDRTLYVLGRAVSVAAPAGAVLWLLANTVVNGETLLQLSASFLDPFARLLGFDGVVLLAFILGLPANEIVFPIIIMTYLSAGSILELDSLTQLHTLLTANGWTLQTAVCVMLFSLMHWPCATTLLTVKKETKSVKWTLAAFFLPTVFGIAACMLCNGLFTLANLLF